MRVQHNIMAMSAYRNYTNNVSAMKKNLEKLSSGYKINRAGDDAAGLAISEKMRAQITGLETAQKNAKDGISLVQTAEGALTEVHDMLNRMVELATQSANGTYESTTDRSQLQKEIKQLREEIDRIADSSNFNGINLLNGEMSGQGALGKASDVTVGATRDGLRSSVESNKGEYSFDLSDMVINGKLTSGGASYTPATISIEIAGVKVGDIKLTDGDFADGVWTFNKAQISLAATSITITGVDFDLEVTDSGIKLTGATDPTADLVSDFNKKGLTIALGASTDVESINNGWDQAVHVDKAFAVGEAEKLAQGSFALTGLKDGSVLTIGTESYTFKFAGGSASAVAGSTLVEVAAAATDTDAMAKAAVALSKKTNSMFDLTADVKNGKVYLTEKKGVLKDYKTWDLTGSDGTKVDATWKNLSTSKSVVQLAQPGAATGKSLTLQIGDTAASYNQLKVDIQDMHCSSLGIDGISVAEQSDAQAAIDIIKAAINQVSDVRGTLGATQNRLEHTINNLSVMTENIQDAESTIRDVDIAEEMMAYTKNNILIQSAQAMLAQANQVPQGVLQLLQ